MPKKGQAKASKRTLPCLFIRRQEVSTYSSYVLYILLPRMRPHFLPARARGDRPGSGPCIWRERRVGFVVTDGDILREHAARPAAPAHGRTCVRRGGRRDRDGGRERLGAISKAAREGPRARPAGRPGKRRDEGAGGAQRFGQISVSARPVDRAVPPAACSGGSEARPGNGSAHGAEPPAPGTGRQACGPEEFVRPAGALSRSASLPPLLRPPHASHHAIIRAARPAGGS